jgi:hypothetical protein
MVQAMPQLRGDYLQHLAVGSPLFHHLPALRNRMVEMRECLLTPHTAQTAHFRTL